VLLLIGAAVLGHNFAAAKYTALIDAIEAKAKADIAAAEAKLRPAAPPVVPVKQPRVVDPGPQV